MTTSIPVVILLSFPILSSRKDHLRLNVFFGQNWYTHLDFAVLIPKYIDSRQREWRFSKRFILLYAATANGFIFRKKIRLIFQRFAKENAHLVDQELLDIFVNKIKTVSVWVCKMAIVIKWCTTLFIYFFFLSSRWVIGCKRFELRVLKLWAKLAAVSNS